MADEAVIRVLLQGSDTRTGDSARSSMSSGGAQDQYELRRIGYSVEQIHNEMRQSAAGAGKSRSGEDSIVVDLLKGALKKALSAPKDLFEDFKDTIWKNFSKSFVEGLGAKAFGARAGELLSDRVRGALGIEQQGPEYGNAKANQLVGYLDKGIEKVKGVKDWFITDKQEDETTSATSEDAGQPLEEVTTEQLRADRRKMQKREWSRKNREKKRNEKRYEQEVSQQMSAEDISTAAAEERARDTGIPEFAAGGPVKKSGLAFIHAGETVLPVAEGDHSGPGELSSDLDVITEGLGLGKALREVKDDVSDSGQQLAKSIVESAKGLFDIDTHGVARTAGRGVGIGAEAAVRGLGKAVGPVAKGVVTGAKGAITYGAEFAGGAVEGLTPTAKVAGAAGLGAAGAIGAGFIAFEIAKFVAEKIKGAVKGVIDAVVGIKDLASSPESDPGVQLAHVGDMASGAADKLGGFGTTLEYAGGFLKSFAGVMQNLTKTADRYGEYSPQIAQAQAYSEIRQTMGDLRRAQVIAPEMVKYLQAQTELQQKFEDAKIRILMKIMPQITHMVQILEALMPAGEGIANAVIALLAPLNLISGTARGMLNIQEDAKIPDIPDPTDQLLNSIRFELVNTGGDSQGLVPDR